MLYTAEYLMTLARITTPLGRWVVPMIFFTSTALRNCRTQVCKENIIICLTAFLIPVLRSYTT